MKKFLTLFLVIIMLVTLSTVFVVSANAEDEIENTDQVIYAASIGEENYSTLQEAIAASVSGDKIVLLANVVLEETVVISEKAITIDLNGYTISSENEIALLTVNNASDLTIVGTGSMISAGEIVFVEGAVVTIFAGSYNKDITEYCIGGYHIIEEDGMFTVGEHDYSNIVIVEPTCTTQGYTAYVCVCGQSYTESVVDCNGHVHGEAVEENRIPPALLDDGQYDSVTYCTVCGDELARETIIIEGAPINWETVLILIVIFLLAFAILI